MDEVGLRRELDQYNECIDLFAEVEKNEEKIEAAHFTLRNYFTFVGQKGVTVFEWCRVKNVFIWEICSTYEKLLGRTAGLVTGSGDESDLAKLYIRQLRELKERFFGFEEAPFTIQRISELLSVPGNFKSVVPFLNAMEKLINVNGIQTPLGDRLTGIELQVFDDDNLMEPKPFLFLQVDECDMDVDSKKHLASNGDLDQIIPTMMPKEEAEK
uniref:DHC_N2 domain-containing protein n=1 Tax=Rhabditophanes sp. KR3021 TaxID=114890 RepID=A0AC35TRE2_9BILA